MGYKDISVDGAIAAHIWGALPNMKMLASSQRREAAMPRHQAQEGQGMCVPVMGRWRS